MGKLVRLSKNSLDGSYSEKGKTYDIYFEPSNLVYDTDTRIVYYKTLEKIYFEVPVINKNGNIEMHETVAKSAIMSTYHGPNGKICRFDGKRITEIE